MALANLITTQLVLQAILVVLLGSLVKFFVALYKNRTKFNGLVLFPSHLKVYAMLTLASQCRLTTPF